MYSDLLRSTLNRSELDDFKELLLLVKLQLFKWSRQLEQ